MTEDVSRASSGFQWFDTHQARTIAAATARFFPTDGLGPGASEAAVVVYIDRALAGHDDHLQATYRQGIETLDVAAAHRSDRPFWRCEPAVQDDVLAGLERYNRETPKSPLHFSFFETLLSHTREGMFSDPLYGGNRDYTGWKLLGYPGVRLSHGPEDFAPGARIDSSPMLGLADLGGRLRPGWMDATPSDVDSATPRTAPQASTTQPARPTGTLSPETERSSVAANTTIPDVCIIGFGAAGSTAAYVLATAGLNVVAIEAGPDLQSQGFHPDELYAAYARGGYGPKFNRELQTWRPNPDAPTARADYSLGKMVNGVGGSTLIYGCWLRRFQHHDFAIRSSTIAQYGEGALPQGSAVVDWPITYDDLEPYYCQVERMTGVAGIPGNIRGVPTPDGNPFEPYRSEPLPLPPVRRATTGAMFTKASRHLGYHPYPVPVSVNSEPYDGRPACTYCSWCTFYVCHNDSKSTAGNTFARKALSTGHVDLKTHSRVVAIHADRTGRVTSVDYLDPDGLVVRQRARTFILSGYTFENVRLLLLATSTSHPNGLGNGRGQVGKYFMTKQYQTIMGLFPGKRLNRFVGAGHQGTILDDFVGDNFDHSGLDFIRGATVSCEEQVQPIGASRMPTPPGVPRWGAGYKRHLLTNWNSIADLRIQPETLPYDDTFLDLDPTVRDTNGTGFPVVRITWDIHENEHRVMGFVEDKVRAILRAMGADEAAGGIWAGPRFTGAGSAHDLGGCRMGTDPATSVVDPTLRLHESPNLYVMSGAVFPSGSGINPTLTLQALVWRACDQLVQELGRRGSL